MPQVTSGRAFDVARKDAFEYLTTPANWPAFYSGLIEVVDANGAGFAKAGDQVGFKYSLLGRVVHGVATLEEIQYGESVRHTVAVPGLPDVHQEWQYLDRGEGCEVSVTMNSGEASTFMGRAIDRFVIPRTLSRDLERTLENISEMFALGIPQ